MRTELVTDALQMALAQRRPAPGLIWHSDQGSQFVRLAFGQQARAAGIARSMGSRGDCFDNAVAESFFATLKKELVHGRCWPSKAELRTEVFEYIEVFFNRRRRHSTLGMLSPADYEHRALAPAGTVSPLRGSHPPTRSSSLHQPRVRSPNQPRPPKRGNSSARRGDLPLQRRDSPARARGRRSPGTRTARLPDRARQR
jgi:hypothetical protein